MEAPGGIDCARNTIFVILGSYPILRAQAFSTSQTTARTSNKNGIPSAPESPHPHGYCGEDGFISFFKFSVVDILKNSRAPYIGKDSDVTKILFRVQFSSGQSLSLRPRGCHCLALIPVGRSTPRSELTTCVDAPRSCQTALVDDPRPYLQRPLAFLDLSAL